MCSHIVDYNVWNKIWVGNKTDLDFKDQWIGEEP